MRHLLALAVFATAPLYAQYYPYTGWCERGAVTATVPSLGQARVAPAIQASYPNCTITVQKPDTSSALIYSDAAGTPLSNPFQASATGLFVFYAAPANYIGTFSGSTIPVPFTRILPVSPTIDNITVGEPDRL